METVKDQNEGSGMINDPSEDSTKIDLNRLHDMRLLIKSSCCSVYKACYNGQAVAVKLFELGVQKIPDEDDEVALRREIFMQEVSVWRDLHHRNVAKFVGTITDVLASEVYDQLPKNIFCCGVVIEYLPRGTLKKHLEKNKKNKLPFKEVIKLALDLAQGLEYLHSKNIVHRDVKTDNLLLDETDVLKIIDFGSAIEEDPDSKSLSIRVGTIRYMAPEVLSEEELYDRRCDVFSFGICLWEMYSCQMPYEDLSRSELASASAMKDKRPKISKRCPRSLAKLLKRCWDADPNKRPEMRDVVQDLETIIKSSLDQPRGCFFFL